MNSHRFSTALARASAPLALVWLLCGSSSVVRAAPTDFIYRDGFRLMLNGQQYKFAGINADTWFGCWSNEVPSDAQLDRFFRELNARSMTRIWVMPGSDLSIMDRIVAKADQYNQYLAPVLGNGNADCDSIGSKSAAWYQSGFRDTYLSHVRTVVTRYKNSRAIGFWEMINEPNGSDPNLKNFYRETSDLIKSIDPDHLVGSGAHAAWSSGSTANYTDQHDLPNVDLISMHEYDDRDFHWADQARIAAQKLNKPFYSGEDGFCCGGGPGPTSWDQNASVLIAEYDKYLSYPECAGLMYWDFKLGHPGPGETINFGDGGWDVLRTYANPYRGGSSTGNNTHPGTPADPPLAPTAMSAKLMASAQANLAWTDNADDESDYKIERRTGSLGTYVQIGSTSADSTTYQDVGLSANTVYFYRVRAHNAGGDSSYSTVAVVATGSSVNTTINDNTLGTSQNQFEYVGTWGYWSGDAAKYQGDDHYSSTANAYAAFRFSAAQVRVYAKKAPHHGVLAMSIDGGEETTVDLYAANPADQVLVYASPVLTVGSHTLRARVTGTKSASSSGTTITLDKIDVLQSSNAGAPSAPSNLAATPGSAAQITLSWTDNANNETGFKIERKTDSGSYVQIATTTPNLTSYQDAALTAGTTYYYRVRSNGASGSDSAYSNEVSATAVANGVVAINDNAVGTGQNQFQYSGTWKYWSGTSQKYLSDDHYSNETDAAAQLQFTGTQLRYYAKKARHHGIVGVSIDGGAETTVDLYAGVDAAADQVLVYSSPGLGAGTHTLRLRVTGTKNASASGFMVTVDKVEISQ